MKHWRLFHLARSIVACLLFCRKHIYLCPSDQIPIPHKSYLNSHTFIHCCTYLIFYPCRQLCALTMCNAQCTSTFMAFLLAACVMKTCKLFVVQIQNWFDYIRYIFRSFYFVQHGMGMGMQAIVSWLHMNSMKMPMRYGIATFRFLHRCWTEQKQQQQRRPPVFTLSFICTDDANSSFI